MLKIRSLALMLAVSLAVPASAGPAAGGGAGWNEAQITWRAYEEGLAAAQKDKKPVCLIFFTAWCPHCTRYSRVFLDPQVVERAKKFVMIRVDSDKNRALSGKYAVDGEYIPRTFFLSPEGALDPAVHSRREQFKYFYDENHPDGILAGMDQALKKWPAAGSPPQPQTENSPGVSPGPVH